MFMKIYSRRKTQLPTESGLLLCGAGPPRPSWAPSGPEAILNLRALLPYMYNTHILSF